MLKQNIAHPPSCYFAACKIITSSEVAYFPQYQFPYVISDIQNKCCCRLKSSFVRNVAGNVKFYKIIAMKREEFSLVRGFKVYWKGRVASGGLS